MPLAVAFCLLLALWLLMLLSIVAQDWEYFPPKGKPWAAHIPWRVVWLLSMGLGVTVLICLYVVLSGLASTFWTTAFTVVVILSFEMWGPLTLMLVLGKYLARKAEREVTIRFGTYSNPE